MAFSVRVVLYTHGVLACIEAVILEQDFDLLRGMHLKVPCLAAAHEV